MTTEPLSLELEDPGTLPLEDETFYILCKALQPGSELSLELATDQITALLPAGRPYSDDVGVFLTVCYEIAKQIPYHHASVFKLVSIVERTLDSFPKVDGSDDIQTDPGMRNQNLAETLRDYHETQFPDDNPAGYINLQNFIARIYERGLLRGCLLVAYTLDNAFEDQWGSSPAGRDACVQAALRSLLLLNDQIYKRVVGDEEYPQPYKWGIWHKQVRAVAAEMPPEKGGPYSWETIQLAKQVIVAMEAMKPPKRGCQIQ